MDTDLLVPANARRYPLEAATFSPRCAESSPSDYRSPSNAADTATASTSPTPAHPNATLKQPSTPAAPEFVARSTASAATLVGHRIQHLRAQCGLTLETMSVRTGLSKGYLSRIENCRQTPPLRTLLRIAQTLGVPLTALLQSSAYQRDGAQHFSLIRATERPSTMHRASTLGYNYVPLTPTSGVQRLRPMLVMFPEGVDRHVFLEHEGDEFMFVLQGCIEWHNGRDVYQLQAGDAIYFDGRNPHRGRALNGAAQALLVVGPAAGALPSAY